MSRRPYELADEESEEDEVPSPGGLPTSVPKAQMAPGSGTESECSKENSRESNEECSDSEAELVTLSTAHLKVIQTGVGYQQDDEESEEFEEPGRKALVNAKMETKFPATVVQRRGYEVGEEEDEENSEFKPVLSVKLELKTAGYEEDEESEGEKPQAQSKSASATVPMLPIAKPGYEAGEDEEEEVEDNIQTLSKVSSPRSSRKKDKKKGKEEDDDEKKPKKMRGSTSAATPKKREMLDMDDQKTSPKAINVKSPRTSTKKQSAYEEPDEEDESGSGTPSMRVSHVKSSKTATGARARGGDSPTSNSKSPTPKSGRKTAHTRKSTGSSGSGGGSGSSAISGSGGRGDEPGIGLMKAVSKMKKERDPDDWNERFQQILHLPESLTKNMLLSELYADFVYAAKTYGRIIISEKFLPNDKKEIKPFDAGGRAGGVKYRCRGILFKFAIDTLNMDSDEEEDESVPEVWMYGRAKRADNLAAKAAGHEMKGLINMFNYREKAVDLHFPLLALIDYRGFRLIAISWLPLSRLIYGSKDAARTVHADDPVLNKAMEKIGRALNLAAHHVGDQPEMLYLCGDIEGHLGQDGKYYCLDFARVFPPENLPEEYVLGLMKANAGREKLSVIQSLLPCNPQPPTSEFLYKLLRPELVKANEVPLNSDALSTFIGASYKERMKAKAGVTQATKRMITETIESFAAELLKNISPSDLNDKSFSLTNEIHRYGINCRHLGRLRRCLLQAVPNPFKPTFVLVEIAARAAKNHLQAKWRKKMEKIKVPSSEPYKEVAVDFFNKLLRDEKNYWSDPHLFKTHIQWSFHHALTAEELDPSFDLRSLFLRDGDMFWSMFFRRLQQLSKVKLTERMNRVIEASKGSSRIHLLSIDITNISTKVKHLDLIDMAEGKMLYLQAQDKHYNLYQKERLFRLASERFKAAIAANTNNPEILFAWGVSLAQESELDDTKKAITKLKEANKKMELCCKLLDPSEGKKISDLELSPSEVQLLSQVYFERALVLVKLAAHTQITMCLYRTSISTASPDYTTDYDFLKKAREVLSNIGYLLKKMDKRERKNAKPLETRLYEEARKIYDKELMLISLDDHCIDMSKQKPKEISESRFTKDTEEEIAVIKQNIYLHAITKFTSAYYWHELFLSFKYSGTIIVQAAEICMRWATLSTLHANFWDQNLFSISGQILEAAILRSSYVFPLVEANERTPGIKSCYIERLSSVAVAARLEDRAQLTGMPRRTVLPAPAAAFASSAPLSKKSPRPLGSGTLLPSGLNSPSSAILGSSQANHGPTSPLSSSTYNFTGIKGQNVLCPTFVIMQALVGVKEGSMGYRKKWCSLVQGNGLSTDNFLILRDPKDESNYKKIFLRQSTIKIYHKNKAQTYCFKISDPKHGKSFSVAFNTEAEWQVWVPVLERSGTNAIATFYGKDSIASGKDNHSVTAIMSTPTLTSNAADIGDTDTHDLGSTTLKKRHTEPATLRKIVRESSEPSDNTDGSDGSDDTSGDSGSEDNEERKKRKRRILHRREKESAEEEAPQKAKTDVHTYHLRLKGSSTSKLTASTFSFPTTSPPSPPQVTTPHLMPSPTTPPITSSGSLTVDVKMAVAKIRQLIPSLHMSTGGKSIENLFFSPSQLSNSSYLFSFAFGRVKIMRIEIMVDEKHIRDAGYGASSVDIGQTIARGKLFVFAESPTPGQWKKLHVALKTGKVTDLHSLCKTYYPKMEIISFEINFSKIQIIDLCAKGLFFWLHIEPLKEAVGLQSFKMFGSLKGLPTYVKHVQSTEVSNTTLPVQSPSKLTGAPILHLSPPHTKKPNTAGSSSTPNTATSSSSSLGNSGITSSGGMVAPPQTRVRTSSISGSGVTYSEENINMAMFTHMFKNYTWLAAVLRVTENSSILSNFVAYIVSQKREEPHFKTIAPPKEWKLLDFIPHAIEYLRFSANEDTIEIPLKKPEMKFDCLILPNSKLVNRHVLASFTGWGIPVHTVNLDYTRITDSDLLVVLTNCGKSLQSLSLKGCAGLTKDSLIFLQHYSPYLQFFGMWDADKTTLAEMPLYVKVNFLDLSSCLSISAQLFSNIMDKQSLKYLDLSLTSGDIEKEDARSHFKEVLRKWARKAGSTIEGFNYKAPVKTTAGKKDKGGERLIDNETLVYLLSCFPNLVFVDLTNLNIGDDVIAALSNCKHLVHFRALGGYTFTDTPFREMLKNMRYLKTLALYRRGAARALSSCSALLPLTTAPLTTLMLRGHSFSSCSELVQLLEASRETLIDVNFIYLSNINDEIVQQLANCPQLQRVQLRGNSAIKDVNTLNELVVKCKKLVAVDFSGLPITDETVELLLKDKPGFQSLEIEACLNLTSKCLSSIKNAPSLRVLSVANLKFVNAENITEVARALPSLLFLKIAGCSLPKQETTLLQQVNERSTADKELTLYDELIRELSELLPNTFLSLTGH